MRRAIETLPDNLWEWDDEDVRTNPYLRQVRRLVSRVGASISGNDMEFPSPMRAAGATIIVSEGYETLRKRYSYAVPTESSLHAVASCGPLIEVGAGKGYWAKMLSEMGVDVMAYDIRRPEQNDYTDRQKPFTEVFVHDVDIVAAYPDRTLFICWPPLNDDMATRALSTYLAAGGSTLIYIGESAGGCTADDTFFAMIDASMVERPIGEADVLRWWGIHDSLWVFDRRFDKGA